MLQRPPPAELLDRRTEAISASERLREELRRHRHLQPTGPPADWLCTCGGGSRHCSCLRLHMACRAVACLAGAAAFASRCSRRRSDRAHGPALRQLRRPASRRSVASVEDADRLLTPFEEEMLTEAIRSDLQKDHYLIVGSHSAVKICAWTRNQLRGRGGCYKHTFYGIASHQCMEVTPSLACANKCTFCWRHHANPVGKEWEWKQDPPEMIVTQAIKEHLKMIKSMEGIRDGRADRFEEAKTVKHCALSLVGEPIMYPDINRLVAQLHQRKISSFLVTNGQFPEAIQRLQDVTQLYVSVDAPTKEGMKAIDRPLHPDFWERFIASLEALREKKHRTVYRLTLMRTMNMEGIADYARLVTIGQPDFIEMKAMVAMGGGGSAKLGDKVTLTREEHMPFHKEVRAFAEALREALWKEFESGNLPEEYELASEHVHSRTVLLARKQFKRSGKWHVWVDYDKFHDLVGAGAPVVAKDYSCPLPPWADVGAEEEGFDPAEKRWYHPYTVKRVLAGHIQGPVLDELSGISNGRDTR